MKVYGTPAEEGGSGKVHLVRAGLFKDVDAVVHWHPSNQNRAMMSSYIANSSAKFRFHGIASHAAAAPQRGRSALDGVEAMNHMVNMMREHVPRKPASTTSAPTAARPRTWCPTLPKCTTVCGTPTATK